MVGLCCSLPLTVVAVVDAVAGAVVADVVAAVVGAAAVGAAGVVAGVGGCQIFAGSLWNVAAAVFLLHVEICSGYQSIGPF